MPTGLASGHGHIQAATHLNATLSFCGGLEMSSWLSLCQSHLSILWPGYCQGTLLARLLSGCVDLFLSSLAFFQLLQILPSFHTENTSVPTLMYN